MLKYVFPFCTVVLFDSMAFLVGEGSFASTVAINTGKLVLNTGVVEITNEEVEKSRKLV